MIYEKDGYFVNVGGCCCGSLRIDHGAKLAGIGALLSCFIFSLYLVIVDTDEMKALYIIFMLIFSPFYGFVFMALQNYLPSSNYRDRYGNYIGHPRATMIYIPVVCCVFMIIAFIIKLCQMANLFTTQQLPYSIPLSLGILLHLWFIVTFCSATPLLRWMDNVDRIYHCYVPTCINYVAGCPTLCLDCIQQNEAVADSSKGSMDSPVKQNNRGRRMGAAHYQTTGCAVPFTNRYSTPRPSPSTEFGMRGGINACGRAMPANGYHEERHSLTANVRRQTEPITNRGAIEHGDEDRRNGGEDRHVDNSVETTKEDHVVAITLEEPD